MHALGSVNLNPPVYGTDPKWTLRRPQVFQTCLGAPYRYAYVEGVNLREQVPIDLNWGRKAFPYEGKPEAYRPIDFSRPELHQMPQYNQDFPGFSVGPFTSVQTSHNSRAPFLQAEAAQAGLQ